MSSTPTTSKYAGKKRFLETHEVLAPDPLSISTPVSSPAPSLSLPPHVLLNTPSSSHTHPPSPSPLTPGGSSVERAAYGLPFKKKAAAAAVAAAAAGAPPSSTISSPNTSHPTSSVFEQQKRSLLSKIDELKRNVETCRNEEQTLRDALKSSQETVQVVVDQWNTLDHDLKLILTRLDPQSTGDEISSESFIPTATSNTILAFVKKLAESDFATLSVPNLEENLAARRDRTRSLLSRIGSIIEFERSRYNELTTRLAQESADAIVQSELQRLRDEIGRWQAHLDTVQMANHDLNRNYQRVTDQLTLAQSESKALQEKEARLLDDGESLQRMTSRLRVDKQELENRINELESELAAARESASALAAASSSSNVNSISASSSSSRGSSEREEILQKLASDLQDEIYRLETVSQSRLNELEKCRQEWATAKEALANASLARKEPSHRNDTDINKYKEEIASLSNIIGLLRDEIFNLEDRLSKEVKLSQECYARERADFISSMQNQERIVQSLRSENETLKRQIASYSGSSESSLSSAVPISSSSSSSSTTKESLLLISSLRGDVDRLRDENKKLKDSLSSLRQEFGLLQEKLVTPNSDLTSQTLSSLHAEIEAARAESSALLEEIDTISNTYAEIQGQNDRLLQQLRTRDDNQASLIAESAKAMQIAQLAKEERDAMRLQLQMSDELRKTLQEAFEMSESRLMLTNEALERCREELRLMSSQIESEKRASSANQEAATGYQQELQDIRGSIEEVRKMYQDCLVETNDERAKRNAISEELEAVKRKLKRRESGAASSAMVEDLENQIEELKSKLVCSIDREKPINCVITRCFHCFNRDNLNAQITARNRKCPRCGQKFSENDVKPLFL